MLNIIQVAKTIRKSQWLTRLSLSLGGSCGSLGELCGAGAFGFSVLVVSTLGAFFSSGSLTFWVGLGAGFSGAVSDGATWVVASADLEMIAILWPGSTVSPSLARSYRSLNRSHEQNLIKEKRVKKK